MRSLRTIISKNSNLILAIFLVVSFALHLFRLWYPDTYYFDEVYHAFTAEAYAKNDPRGYEWWNSAPEGFAYEWLHPPLAKLFQAGSIKILGDHPFSWRFPGAIFGTLTGLLLYAVGRNIFKSKTIGFLSLFLWTFDGLAFTSSRITMNDIYLAFWILLAFYLFLAKKSVWVVGLVLGLAVSTKWPGVFAAATLFLLWFRREIARFRPSSFLTGFFAFFIVPSLIYLFSYSQFFLQGHTFDQFKELHKQIWWYQTNLKATHPYQSTPYEWIFMLRPLYSFTQNYGDKVANMYLMGNPFVFWGGILAVFYTIIYLMQKKIKKRLNSTQASLAALLFGYLGMFIPWVAAPRIMFIYHYVPALPFLFLVLAWFLNELIKEKKRIIVVGYLLLVFFSFAYFYPHWTGLPVPSFFDMQYYWLPSWR